MHSGLRGSRRHAILLVFLMLSSTVAILPMANMAASTRTTTVWSGSVTLPDGYTVESGDILIVQAGTNIFLGNDKDILVAGRMTVQGTTASPVILDAPTGNHDGIIFNYTSSGLGSKIDNLTIKNSEYAMTIYSSDPILNNLRVENADRVAVDLFDSASPLITNLVIIGGGQDIPLDTDWRKGIGLSIGAGSAPIVNGVIINQLTTRGINYWGNSGGMLSNLQISNISGATTAISAGIWIEDSLPLIVDANVSRCDNGVYIRHITQGWTTRPTFLRLGVENSLYRGVMVEQYNHSQFSNLPINAIFENLEIRGTGGLDAKTPGLGISALEVNTSGIKIDGGLIEDNPVVGFRAYMIDSSTIVDNLTILRSGDDGISTPFNDRAGLFWRSANWGSGGPPLLTNLVVKNSTGPGVLMWKGGAYGTNWEISGNGANGVDFREFHPQISNIETTNNQGHGISVRDSSNVELSYILSSGNGFDGDSFSIGAGYYFEEANDVISSGKNVSCYECSSIGNEYGVIVRDSIDLQLLSMEIRDPALGAALDIDNSGLTHAGTILIDDLLIQLNSSTYALDFDQVDANVANLDLNGVNGGFGWRAASTLTSYLNNSVIRGDSSCFDIWDHGELLVENLDLFCTSSTRPTITNSFVNFTSSSFINLTWTVADTFSLGNSSHVRWISSGPLVTPSSTASDSILDVMWMVEAQVVNQLLHQIPYSQVNLTFDQFEPDFSTTLPYSGIDVLGPFVGKRWTAQQSWSSVNSVYGGCDYDGVHNNTSTESLDSNIEILCILELSNQPPFILWSTPIDEEIFASGSEILFNASESWDLDEDVLSYSWSSNIDGNLICGITGNSSIFIANNGSECISDGEHEITLEVCDTDNHCVTETRTIELVNRPPLLSVDTTPDISAWGTLYLGQTANISIDLTGTIDPEGDLLDCWVVASYEINTQTSGCPMLIERDFLGAPNEFQVTVYASDNINTPVSWTFNVELFNELPEAMMNIERSGLLSQNLVRLDGTDTSDPEANQVKYEFWSDIDGLLGSGITPDDVVEWIGTLSKGVHEITMYASDDRPNHAGRWTSVSELISVENSLPVALISAPTNSLAIDSSQLVSFDATGSGDWDVACTDLIDNGSGLICNPHTEVSQDLVSVIWQSDLMSEPLGADWHFEARLPEGQHTITLILDDGDGEVGTDSIQISVEQAAPVLILDSPQPDAEVFSNLPVLFDFRRSFDPDGDDFTVTVTSDLIAEPILHDRTIDYWYNDYIPAGIHELTFKLTDTTGKIRIHTQILTVQETAPVAGIKGLDEGEYIPPGTEIELNGSASYDYDNDIVLYEWSTSDGADLGDKETVLVNFQPGPIQITLYVQDSRGASDSITINLIIGSSTPQLFELTINPNKLQKGEPNPIFLTVRLDDLDGTTQIVLCELKAGGEIHEYELRDDGLEGDIVAGDGIWTLQTVWTVDEGTTARVEVWAVDGDIVSPAQIEIIQIDSGEGENFLAWLLGSGLPVLIGLIIILTILGMVYSANRRHEMKKDLETIESWSNFDPRELDEEFDRDEDIQ